MEYFLSGQREKTESKERRNKISGKNARKGFRRIGDYTWRRSAPEAQDTEFDFLDRFKFILIVSNLKKRFKFTQNPSYKFVNLPVRFIQIWEFETLISEAGKKTGDAASLNECGGAYVLVVLYKGCWLGDFGKRREWWETANCLFCGYPNFAGFNYDGQFGKTRENALLLICPLTWPFGHFIHLFFFFWIFIFERSRNMK